MIMDPHRPPDRFSKKPVFIALAVAFLALAPMTTFLLIILKGLPDFAAPHVGAVLLWVYSVTWIPALLAGMLLSGVVVLTVSKTRYFHQPFDFGRCVSLGAIAGAMTEALSTMIYRTFSHRLFSDFWIAGAMIAGCLAGGVLVAGVLWNLSRKPGRV